MGILKDYESVWVKQNLTKSYGIEKDVKHLLNDEEYIDYKIWEDINKVDMYKKYFPEANVIKGNNPNIIFHAGCLGCISQRNNGIRRCTGCKYFKSDWSKPDLHQKGEYSHKLTGKELNDLLNKLRNK